MSGTTLLNLARSAHQATTTVCRRRMLAGLLLSILGGCAPGAEAPSGEPRHRVDTSQAEVMLEFLEQASNGQINDQTVEAVMAEPGTALVIGQMNLMRRVTGDQYEEVLRSILAAEPPDVAPADDSERASRGVAGLTNNVWPILRWGMTNTGLLAKRLEEIHGLDVYDTARDRALAFLPASVDVSPEVSIVMGGRAGAAALAGGKIYVDILMLSYLDDLGRRPYDAETDLIDFFSHEMHHIGYSEIEAERLASLDLDTGQRLAFSLLSSVVSEGSATYLVSGHRDLERTLSGSGSMSRLAERGDELLADCERVLLAVQAGEIANGEQYDAATEFLLGSGAHMAGTLMLSRIDDAGGLDAVMAVIADPRKLLTEYNAAVGDGSAGAGVHVFDPKLAVAVRMLGEN